MSKEFEDHLVRFRNLPLPVRVVYGRPRTFIAIAIGIVAFFLLPDTLRLVTRLVVGWDAFAALYLVLAYVMMLRCDVAHIRRSAVLQDDGRFVMLLVTALGAFASLAAIVFELGASKGNAAGLILAIVTIVLSWTVVHTAFALHYAHEFYRGRKAGRLAVSERRRACRGGLLGLRLLLVRDRHDRAGFRRRHHRQDHPPHRDRARHHLVRVQHRAACVDGQYRGQCDLTACRPALNAGPLRQDRCRGPDVFDNTRLWLTGTLPT